MKGALNKFTTLLDSIVKRPGMYGVNRVEDIGFIILGIELFNKDNEISAFISEFKQYVANDSNFNKDTQWQRIIRFNCASDSHSIEIFRLYLQDFILRYNTQNSISEE